MKKIIGILALVLVGCGPNTEELGIEAVKLESENNYKESLKLRNQILEADPSNINALYNRAVCYQAIGKYDLAEQDYTQVLNIDSMHTEANFNLGALYQATKKIDLSIECFTRIIGGNEAILSLDITEGEQSFNIYNEAVYQRGNSFFMQKKWADAEVDFQNCVSKKYKLEKSRELLNFCIKQNQVY